MCIMIMMGFRVRVPEVRVRVPEAARRWRAAAAVTLLTDRILPTYVCMQGSALVVWSGMP